MFSDTIFELGQYIHQLNLQCLTKFCPWKDDFDLDMQILAFFWLFVIEIFAR